MGNLIASVLDPGNLTGINDPPKAKNPKASDIANQYQALLDAYTKGAPKLFDLQQEYQPRYQDLATQSLDRASTDILQLFGGTLLPGAQTAWDTANTATRTSNLNDLRNLGPGFVNGLGAANPGMKALTDSLNKITGDQLNLGTSLDPNQTRTITSGVRSDWADRGLGTSDPAMLAEAMQLQGGGQNLLNQRIGNAASVAQLDANLYETPMLAELGLTSQAPQLAQNLGAQAAGVVGASGPTILPTDQAFGALDTAFNSTAATNIANANNEAAIMGAGFSY